jgi:hypothetical protein
MLADWPLSKAAGSGGVQVAVAGDDASDVCWFPTARLHDMLTKQKMATAAAKQAREAANKARKAAHAKKTATTTTAAAAAEEGGEGEHEDAAEEDVASKDNDDGAAGSDAVSSVPSSSAISSSSSAASAHPQIIPSVVRVVATAESLRRAQFQAREAKTHPRRTKKGAYMQHQQRKQKKQSNKAAAQPSTGHGA